MRIGTWNLAGKWDARYASLMRRQKCDVWLLTEVNEAVSFDGYAKHPTKACMAPHRKWAAILSREPLVGMCDPHPASALARVGDWLFCSSVLPWKACGNRSPWVGHLLAEKTEATLNELLDKLPKDKLIWGGDWNHSLSGREYVGSLIGREHVLKTVDLLRLQVPTEKLPHRISTLLAIDHIAVPRIVSVIDKSRVEAVADGERMSDHEAYVVEIG